MNCVIPLDCLAPGESAQIVEVEGDTTFLTRLQEIGLNIGAQIRMVKAGSPCIVATGGHQVSLRTNELATVLVELKHG